MDSPRSMATPGVDDITLPQLSASDSCVLNVVSPRRRGGSEDYEWCLRLAEGPDASYLRPWMLDMYGRWRDSSSCFAVLGQVSDQARAKGLEAYEAFFNERQTQHFAFFTKDYWRFLSSLSEAKASARTADLFLLVALPAKPVQLSRILWRKGAVAASISQTPRSECSSPRASLHDLSKFHYAGQLKKSSFSPLLPYNSVLLRKPPQQDAPPDVSDLVRLAQVSLQQERYLVDSMALQVVEDCEGGRWLLNVTNVRWCERERKTLPPISIRSEEGKTTLRSKVKSCARELFAKSLKRPPYIDTAEIHRKNVDMYVRTLSKDCYSPGLALRPASPVSWSLTQIAARLDRHKNSCPPSKQPQVALADNDLKDLIHKIYLRFQGDEALGRYFASSRIQHLSEQFYQAIARPKDYCASLRVRAAHQGLCISSDTFTQFLSGFRAALQDAQVAEETVDAICERMGSYEKDVVTL